MAFPRELSFTLNERATTASFGLNCIQYDCTRRRNVSTTTDTTSSSCLPEEGIQPRQTARGQVFCSLLSRSIDAIFSPRFEKGNDFWKRFRDAPPFASDTFHDAIATRGEEEEEEEDTLAEGWKKKKDQEGGERDFAITIAVGGNEWLERIFGKIG